MRNFIEVLNVELVSLYLDHCTFVLENITVIRSTKDCDYAWQLLGFFPIMNFVPLNLHLVGSDN